MEWHGARPTYHLVFLSGIRLPRIKHVIQEAQDPVETAVSSRRYLNWKGWLGGEGKSENPINSLMGDHEHLKMMGPKRLYDTRLNRCSMNLWFWGKFRIKTSGFELSHRSARKIPCEARWLGTHLNHVPKPNAEGSSEHKGKITHSIHVWYIYLHLPYFTT